MLHPKIKLLEVLPLLCLLLIIHHDIGLIWRRRGSKTNPSWTPVLELFLRASLDTSDKLLHYLKRAPMMQKQIDKRGELPVVVNRCPGSVSSTSPSPEVLASFPPPALRSSHGHRPSRNPEAIPSIP